MQSAGLPSIYQEESGTIPKLQEPAIQKPCAKSEFLSLALTIYKMPVKNADS